MIDFRLQQCKKNAIHIAFIPGNILYLFFFLEYRSHCSILNKRREEKLQNYMPSYELMHAEQNC